jgi:hypothetical protein
MNRMDEMSFLFHWFSRNQGISGQFQIMHCQNELLIFINCHLHNIITI